MNTFYILFSFLGGPGEAMLNPEVLKCHEDLITLETYVQLGPPSHRGGVLTARLRRRKMGPERAKVAISVV